MDYMFKNGFLFLMVTAIVFVSCQKKTDEIFEKTPDERLAEALAQYQQTLVGAANGWKLVILPKGLEAEDNGCMKLSRF